MATKSKNTPLNDSQDWFAPVIEVSGSVTTCLNSVLAELDLKKQFVQMLNRKIGDLQPGGVDKLSAISQRVRVLEGTLRFRIGLLQPDRRGPWFRTGVTSSGPFTASILNNPVFCTYPDPRWGEIKKGLLTCWNSGNLKTYPFPKGEETLWKVLLDLKSAIVAMNIFEAPFENMTLMNCLDVLPPVLESKFLRAFLINVRGEFVSTQERIQDCYQKLLEASEKFWKVQETDSEKVKSPKFENPAHKIREEFKKRREQPKREPLIATRADLEALKFMGFSDYPKMDELKKRYHHLAKSLHPDVNGGSDKDFKVLTLSYERLSNKATV